MTSVGGRPARPRVRTRNRLRRRLAEAAALDAALDVQASAVGRLHGASEAPTRASLHKITERPPLSPHSVVWGGQDLLRLVAGRAPIAITPLVTPQATPRCRPALRPPTSSSACVRTRKRQTGLLKNHETSHVAQIEAAVSSVVACCLSQARAQLMADVQATPSDGHDSPSTSASSPLLLGSAKPPTQVQRDDALEIGGEMLEVAVERVMIAAFAAAKAELQDINMNYSAPQSCSQGDHQVAAKLGAAVEHIVLSAINVPQEEMPGAEVTQAAVDIDRLVPAANSVVCEAIAAAQMQLLHDQMQSAVTMESAIEQVVYGAMETAQQELRQGQLQERIVAAFGQCRVGKYREVEEALELGVPVEARFGRDQNTMLLVCAQNGQKRIAKLLLRNRANINTQNAHGESCLHCCIKFNYNELADYLRSKGADDTVLNLHGQTCYQIAGRAEMSNSHEGGNGGCLPTGPQEEENEERRGKHEKSGETGKVERDSGGPALPRLTSLEAAVDEVVAHSIADACSFLVRVQESDANEDGPVPLTGVSAVHERACIDFESCRRILTFE